MSEKFEKVPLREAIPMNIRALKLFCGENPGLFLSSTIYKPLEALAPYVPIWFSARVISELAGNRDPHELWKWVILTLAATVLTTLTVALVKRWHFAHVNGCWVRFHHAPAEKFTRMDYAAMDNQKTWDTYSQIRQNDNWGGWGLRRAFFMYEWLLGGLIGLAGAVALTYSLFASPVAASSGAGNLSFLGHPLMSVLVIALLFGTAGISTWLRVRARSMWADSAEANKEGNRYFFYYGMEMGKRSRAADIRLYRQDEISNYYMNTVFLRLFKKVFAPFAYGSYSLLITGGAILEVVFTGLIYFFVCLKAWAGAFDVGMVTQYVAAITAVSASIGNILIAVGEMPINAGFLRTTYAFLDIPSTMYQGSLTTEKRSDRKYEVEFRNVSFKYPGTDTYALKNVSMKFEIGTKLAIVGENGSGKSTFIKLLCRLYDPDEGEILLNGINIRKYSYADYQKVFSVVFQDFQLIAQPLGANVAGRREYDRARAERALRDAGFGDRLDAMPQGLDTMLYKDLDDSGVEISGGEAQKIAIARALYKDAPFIILDEPTAALDPIAEAEIYAQFNEISGDRTALYISHRLSSCRFCDEILVFDGGSIVQKGSHDSLVSSDGKYRELWDAQAQYYQKEA